MTEVHQCGKVDFPFLSLCFQNILLFCSLRWIIATLATVRASPILCPLQILQLDFSLLEAWERLMHQISVTQRIASLLRDVIFMMSCQTRFSNLSRGFMSLHDACLLFLLEFVGVFFLACSFLQPI